MPMDKERVEEMRNDAEFHKVEALQLSFQNILQIENLTGFDMLTKLQLDNNIIEKIENLEHLTNLTWLDLSFNNISTIEGLDQLTKLTDLSLFSNCIRSLSGFDELSELNMLSVGKNLISSLDDVLYLRRFRKLRMLNLAGNAIAADADYRNFVIAHLSFNDWKSGGHLSYLDYRLVEVAAVGAARDQFQDAMLELTDKEKMDQETEVKAEERRLESEKLVVAGIQGVDELVSDMLQTNPDRDKLKLLPGYDEKLQDIMHAYKTHAEPFIKGKEPLVQERLDAAERFESTLSARRDQNAANSIGLITKFRKKFKKLAAVFADENEELPETITQDIDRMRSDLKILVNQLLELQLQQKATEEEMIAELESITMERKRRIVEENQEFFAKIRVDVNEFVEQVRTDANTEIENVEKITEEAKAREDAMMSAEDHDADADDNAHLEVNYGDISKESAEFLLDKDQVRNSIQASADFFLGFIDAKETEILTAENTRTEELIQKWTSDSTNRDRSRTSEIVKMSGELEASIAHLETEANER